MVLILVSVQVKEQQALQPGRVCEGGDDAAGGRFQERRGTGTGTGTTGAGGVAVRRRQGREPWGDVDEAIGVGGV